ncbi:uncharacterized protein [Mobula birostris]|uniref:uncharacterized protein isoform X2 n=1 Tax=Mobula birostris TaxID=1983395 RepID=UPI003B280B9D
MDVNVELAEMGPQSPSNDGLTATSPELNIGEDIDEREDPPIASGSGGMPTTAQTGAHEQESKLKIGNRPFRLICLLCLVTSALILIVIGLSIHVSQIRQSQTALDQNCHELNSTLQTKVSEISHLNHSEKTCLKNLTALKTNLSVLVRMHNDLRHQITEIKTKLRSVKNSMAQICEFLISRREERCPGNWTESADRCYFISTLEKSYDAARNHCSNVDASLLEINSNKEKPSRCCGWKQLRRWVQAFKSRVHKLLSSLGGKSHASS